MLSLKYTIKYDLDDPNTTLLHKKIIRSKPFLEKIYIEWYSILHNSTRHLKAHTILELGSGGGFLKDLYPHIKTSDIMPLPGCDSVVSAEQIPYQKNELGSIVMLNVFHHIPNPGKFLLEAQRTLIPGGKLVMIEPSNTFFSRFIYQTFHHERFDPKAVMWEIPYQGPLSSANGANPWIIFIRDKARFEKEFPQLAIRKISYHTPLRYLLSGGVSRHPLVPAWSYNFFTFLERLVNPLMIIIAMFMTIEIEKKEGNSSQ